MDKFMWGLSSIKIKTSWSETRGKDNLTRLLSKNENDAIELGFVRTDVCQDDILQLKWYDGWERVSLRGKPFN